MKRAEQLLIDLLKENGLTIAFAESVSCGLLTHKTGTVSDTSQVLKGSIISYTPEIKTAVLKVSKKLIAEKTCESQEVTDVMALGLSRIIPADICAAITGLAAPGGSETNDKPVGTVFYSFRFKRKTYRLRRRFRGSPLEIKEKACKEFFRFIKKEVQKQL